ncbi:hypothetical protein CSW98_17470 [Vibrio sp. HA2012]|uniref:DUF3465 domain-containing protein n=1 Tax=Vibrio sp. HA2012 TaxID=1971595 RepID=UPI000C2B5873|nr:DUF3465 domain-containing protein [Vibrio sp. HA2012]PJC84915.1 hypothetical protein CSW98_17470 [Vibrio sp. HA2012]
MKNFIALLVIVFGVITFNAQANDFQLMQAFENQQSNVQIMGSGKVIRLLSDDNKGSRHQRFILQLNNKQTLLVAHNIDLAPKISSLSVGDHVQFYGEYEWNHNGGVIHWTHKDPQNKHANGWLKHMGKMYE